MCFYYYHAIYTYQFLCLNSTAKSYQYHIKCGVWLQYSWYETSCWNWVRESSQTVCTLEVAFIVREDFQYMKLSGVCYILNVSPKSILLQTFSRMEVYLLKPVRLVVPVSFPQLRWCARNKNIRTIIFWLGCLSYFPHRKIHAKTARRLYLNISIYSWTQINQMKSSYGTSYGQGRIQGPALSQRLQWM